MAKASPDPAVKEVHDVLIVGGGPVGLFCGLVLAQKGIDVLVMEKETDIVQSPRALMYFPIILHEFEKAGILSEVVAAGYKNQSGLTFRTAASASNKVLAQIPPGTAPHGGIDYGVQLGQPKLTAIIRKHALKLPNFSLRYGTRFVNLEQDDEEVNVVAATTTSESGNKEEKLHFSSRFVIACDGASSAVRKYLNIPFQGYTWSDWRFLAINICYDFSAHGYGAANHIIDPEDWAVIVRASNEQEGLWRIATGVDPKIPVEELEKWLPKKLDRLLPGKGEYEITAVNPYWAHERVAEKYTQGRVVLAGDAAHANNPLTALGLSTGLIDIAVLTRLLPQAFPHASTSYSSSQISSSPSRSKPWPHLLSQYAHLRRTDFVNRVQKFALEGKLRMHSTDPVVVKEREGFFKMLNKNPGFGAFVASTMMETLPDELEMGFWAKSIAFVANVWKTVGIIVRIIYWKIRAEIL